MTKLANYKLNSARYYKKEYTERFKKFVTISDTEFYYIIEEEIIKMDKNGEFDKTDFHERLLDHLHERLTAQ